MKSCIFFGPLLLARFLEQGLNTGVTKSLAPSPSKANGGIYGPPHIRRNPSTIVWIICHSFLVSFMYQKIILLKVLKVQLSYFTFDLDLATTERRIRF